MMHAQKIGMFVYLTSRCNSRTRSAELYGCLPRLLSNSNERDRHGKGRIHYSLGHILLPSHAFWLKECWGNIKRMVSKMFKDQLWHIMEAYIDDMVIKSMDESNHLAPLTELFSILKKHKLKLKAKKNVRLE